MSKYDTDYPGYHIGGVRVTRHAFITHSHCKEIADAADRGAYWYGDGGPVPRDVLTVFSKTGWPEGLDLETVFPMKRAKDPSSVFAVGDFSPFLAASEPVQSDFGTTSAAIQETYEKLRKAYFPQGKRASLADLRALRKETTRTMRLYRRSVDRIRGRIRAVLGVLFIELHRGLEFVSDGPPPTGADALSARERTEPLLHFWRQTSSGGPSSWLSSVAASLLFLVGSGALIDFQSTAIEALLKRRDEIITKALPVEFRRIACEKLLWNFAHSELVLPWSKEDSVALLTPREEFDAGTTHTQKIFFDLFDFIKGLAALAEDPDQWTPSDEGWNTKVKVLRAFIRNTTNGMTEESLGKAMTRLEKRCRRNRLPVIESDESTVNKGEAFVSWVVGIGGLHRPTWETSD